MHPPPSPAIKYFGIRTRGRSYFCTFVSSRRRVCPWAGHDLLHHFRVSGWRESPAEFHKRGLGRLISRWRSW